LDNTSNSAPGGTGTINSVTPFIYSNTFSYIQIIPANETPTPTTVTFSAGHGGTVTGSGGAGAYTVTPSAGYVIDQIFINGVSQTIPNRNSFTHTFPPDVGAQSIFATFAYTVNFNTPANGTLTVTSAGNPIMSGTIARGGQVLNITATPNSGYVLANLFINGIDVTAAYNNGYIFMVGTSGDKRTLPPPSVDVLSYGAQIMATFIDATATTRLVTVNNGTGGGSFTAGSMVHITANAPPAGQQFKEWQITPAVTFIQGTGTSAPDAVFTMPASNVTATAIFEDIPEGYHLITVTRTGNGVANANVQSAPPGAEVTLRAMPDPGWYFVRWEAVSGGVTLANTAAMNTTFTMPDTEVSVNAVFMLIPDVVIDPAPQHFGTWTGSGTRTAIVNADPANFIQLTLGGFPVGSANYTVTAGSTAITLHESYLKTLANGNYTYRAEFTHGYVYLNLTVDVRTAHGAPQTGVDRSLILPILALSLGIVCITTAEFYRRRIRPKKEGDYL